MTPRAPSSTPRTRMPLPGHCYVPPPHPWSWPGQGPAAPAINMHLYQPVPPPPGPGATVDSFLSFVGGPPPPQPQQMTPASSVKITSSYPTVLGRIFSSPCPALATGPAGPAPAQPQSGLPSGPPIPLAPAAATPTAAPRPTTSQPAVTPVASAPVTETADHDPRLAGRLLPDDAGPMAGFHG